MDTTVTELVNDMRLVMAPNTAGKLKERKCVWLLLLRWPPFPVFIPTHC